MKRNDTRRFANGSGCFTCKCCGKRTRNVDYNGQLELCPKCLDDAEAENEHSDYHDDPVEGCRFCDAASAA